MITPLTLTVEYRLFALVGFRGWGFPGGSGWVPDRSRRVGRVGVFGPVFALLFFIYASKTQALLRHARFHFMKEVTMNWCGLIRCEGVKLRTSQERKTNQRRGRHDSRNPDPSHAPGMIGHPKPKTFGKVSAAHRSLPVDRGYSSCCQANFRPSQYIKPPPSSPMRIAKQSCLIFG